MSEPDQTREAIVRLLDAEALYDVESYGWLSADDIDPEYEGHAAAQLASLASEVIDAVTDERRGHTPQLKDWQKDLIVAEGDLVGFLRSSRWAIGEMLLLANDEELFATHFMSAMLLLGAASDRLREFFICAVFNQRPEKWKPPGYAPGDRVAYIEPFKQAQQEELADVAPRVETQLSKLSPLVEAIAGNRKKRNAIAHRVATSEGRRKQRITGMTWAPVQEIDWSQIDFSKVIDPEYEDKQQARARKIEPIAWYKLLIEASNLVFLIEHSLRVARRDGPVSGRGGSS